MVCDKCEYGATGRCGGPCPTRWALPCPDLSSGISGCPERSGSRGSRAGQGRPRVAVPSRALCELAFSVCGGCLCA